MFPNSKSKKRTGAHDEMVDGDGDGNSSRKQRSSSSSAVKNGSSKNNPTRKFVKMEFQTILDQMEESQKGISQAIITLEETMKKIQEDLEKQQEETALFQEKNAKLCQLEETCLQEEENAKLTVNKQAEMIRKTLVEVKDFRKQYSESVIREYRENLKTLVV
jgi:phage shock protein A